MTTVRFENEAVITVTQSPSEKYTEDEARELAYSVAQALETPDEQVRNYGTVTTHIRINEQKSGAGWDFFFYDKQVKV